MVIQVSRLQIGGCGVEILAGPSNETGSGAHTLPYWERDFLQESQRSMQPLYKNGYLASFRRVKWPGYGIDHHTHVALSYTSPPSTLLWLIIGWMFLWQVFVLFWHIYIQFLVKAHMCLLVVCRFIYSSCRNALHGPCPPSWVKNKTMFLRQDQSHPFPENGCLYLAWNYGWNQ
jgi:hypothetical protein